MSPAARLYLFCDAEAMFVAKPAGEAAGYKFRKPLVWDKKKIGLAALAARRVFWGNDISDASLAPAWGRLGEGTKLGR